MSSHYPSYPRRYSPDNESRKHSRYSPDDEGRKRRAEIRIKESRAKPIDILAINLRLADENEDVDEALEIDIDEPYTIFENLNLQEVEELHQDIQKYLSLEKNPNNLDFWRAMIVVC
ncbi:hypothetical protein RhiirA5_349744, partial [Rhizophagus irregularis]